MQKYLHVPNISHPEVLDKLRNPERKLYGCVNMFVCVYASDKKEQIKFWPSSSPGLGLIQGTFAARCAPLQPRPLPCHFTVAYCSALSFLTSFFLSHFSFSFDILTPDFQGQCDIQTQMLYLLKYKDLGRTCLDSMVFCINWPLGVSSWLKIILLYVWRASQPHSKVDLC